MSHKNLTQDFDAHVLFTFAEIPERPWTANRWARLKRWMLIAFVESWLAVWLFRVKMALLRARVPALPGVCDMLSRALFGVQIGNRAEIGPGLMITHGNVVIDGRVRIGRRCQINPWVTIGLSNSKKLGFSVDGPTIGDYVHIGTGAKVLGPVNIGDYARIGANAVVVHDVPPYTTVVGIPARTVVPRGPSGELSANGRALAQVRGAIFEFRLRRRSLQSLVDILTAAFESGPEEVRAAQDQVKEQLVFLEAIAATGSSQTSQVGEALASIEAALPARQPV